MDAGNIACYIDFPYIMVCSNSIKLLTVWARSSCILSFKPTSIIPNWGVKGMFWIWAPIWKQKAWSSGKWSMDDAWSPGTCRWWWFLKNDHCMKIYVLSDNLYACQFAIKYNLVLEDIGVALFLRYLQKEPSVNYFVAFK